MNNEYTIELHITNNTYTCKILNDKNNLFYYEELKEIENLTIKEFLMYINGYYENNKEV